MNERLILMTKRLLLSLALVSTAHAQWEQLPPLPEPNGGFVCGSAAGKIVVAGGTNWTGGRKNWLRTVHTYDPTSQTWKLLRELNTPLAYGLGLTVPDGLIVSGGSDGQHPLSQEHVFDGAEWVTMTVRDMPHTVVLSTGGIIGETLWRVGGTDDAANLGGLSRDIHVTSLSHREVVAERVGEFPGRAFAVAASAVLGKELFIFGGMHYNEAAKEPENSSQAYAWQPFLNEWRALRRLATPNRGLSAVALDDGHIYIAGGYRDDFTAEAVIYDVKADSYRKAPSLPYAAMVGLVKLDGFVYCLGGEDKKQSRTNKFFRIPVPELLK